MDLYCLPRNCNNITFSGLLGRFLPHTPCCRWIKNLDLGLDVLIDLSNVDLALAQDPKPCLIKEMPLSRTECVPYMRKCARCKNLWAQ